MLDVALTVAPDRDGHGLKWAPLVRATWQLAVNRRPRLARRVRVTPEEVSREPLLVFRQRDYPEYWNVILTWLRNQRQAPAIAEEYDGVTSLLAAVESGLGIAIVTKCTARLASEGIRLRALSS